MLETDLRIDPTEVTSPQIPSETYNFSILDFSVETGMEELKGLESQPTLTHPKSAEYTRILEETDETAAMYEEALLEIDANAPSVIDDFEELGVDDALDNPNLSGSMYGIVASWEQEYVRDRDAHGLYIPYGRQVLIAGEQPSLAERLIAFGTRGYPDRRMLTYLHEVAHDRQYYFKEDGKIQRISSAPTELKEGQAWLLSKPGFSTDNIATSILSARRRDGTLAYPDANPTKLVSVLNAFKLFNALELSQTDITRLVRNPGEWDESRKSYTNVFALTKKLVTMAGLPPQEILMRGDLLRSIDEAKARVITTDILSHELG
jgi:hypothetical protein